MKTIFVKQLGSLKIERVLIKIDYPILFLCQNEKGRLFMFLEMDSNEHHEQWVAVKVNDDVINKMYRHELSIQKAFINTDVEKYFIINHLYNSDSYECVTSNRMPENILNDGNDFIPIYDNSESILQSAKNISLRTDSPVLDIHLKPYSHKHSIKASLLAFITNKVLTLFNYNSNKSRSDLMVEFEPGSFVLRFYSNSVDNLLPKESTFSAFNSISKIIGAESIDDISKEVIAAPKVLNPAKDLIGRLSKENEDFDIFITNNDEQPVIKKINIDKLAKINNELKQYKIEETSIKSQYGILRSYDSVRKTFKFKLEDSGEIICGNWDKAFVDNKFVMHERYLATFNLVEETYGDGFEKRFKKNHRLMKMEQK